ncbi:GlxA family transcriptional regulator [Marinagarivorans algicola]|uniref:GlxA family transcriptional regulator n=1 Tax=Marinagarivorans algicola TaxID=1513270 RepID=UPI0037365A4D
MQPVIFLLYPNMLATSVTLPLEMLRAAWAMRKVEQHHLPPLTIEFRSQTSGTINTHTGLPLQSSSLDTPIPRDSLIFLPALWRDPIKILNQQPDILNWLSTIPTDCTLAAVGTSVCFLAQAQLLQHQFATTHWHFFDRFSRRYPDVKLQRDRFITQSHASGQPRIFCTASINALAELTAFFIQEQYGSAIAQTVERNFFHEIRQPNTQAGLSNTLTSDERVALAVAKLDELLTQPANTPNYQSIDIAALAASLGISVRSLNRHFKNALNLSPLQYVQRHRMTTAKDMLKSSNLSIAEVANYTGLQDPQHFSRLFKKTFGVPPNQYRTTVRSKLFS